MRMARDGPVRTQVAMRGWIPGADGFNKEGVVLYKSRYCLIIPVLLMSITAICFAQLGGGVGQEMKQIEKQTADPNFDSGYQRQSTSPKISIKEGNGTASDTATNSTIHLDQKEKKSFFQKILFWKKSDSGSKNKSAEPAIYTPKYAVANQEQTAGGVTKKSRVNEPLPIVTPAYEESVKKTEPAKHAAKKTSAELTVVKPEYAEAKSAEVVKSTAKKASGAGELSIVKPEYAKSESKGAAKEAIVRSDAPAVVPVVMPAYEKEKSKESVAKRAAPAVAPVVTPVYAKATTEEVPVKVSRNAARSPDAPLMVTPVYAKNESTIENAKSSVVAAPLSATKDESLLSNVHLLLEGDGSLLEDAGLAKQLKLDLATIANDPKRSPEEKQAAVKLSLEECNKKLIETGYYLASLWLLDANIDKSEFSVFVDAGRIRETKFYDASKAEGADKKDFSHKYFSEKQLRRKMGSIQKDRIFNYNDFRNDIFTVNSHPDVMIDADLRVKKEIVDGRLRRYVDADYMVKETVPLHAVLSLDNSGTDATGNWGAGLTVQHLNLTKHDDVLSVNVPISIDRSIKSVSSSYYLPYEWWKGGSYTLYGGYSDMWTEDIIKDFDEKGEGYFTGIQISHKLMPNSKKHALDVAAGITYRDITSTTYFMDTALPSRHITMVPLSLTLSYSSLKPGVFGGRNFFSAQTIYHSAGILGSSDDEEFAKQRASAESEYWIEKLQGARIQPLFGKKGSEGTIQDQWVLFLKGDAQIASGTLVPAEQMGVGGAGTVRGYEERVNLGDNAFVGTAELRTPLLLGMISSPFLSKEEKSKRLLDPIDYLQFLTFFDYGYVEYADPQPGEEPSDSIYSVGAGVRMSLTKHSQMSFDWGFPLTQVEDSEGKNGRFHLNIKFQF